MATYTDTLGFIKGTAAHVYEPQPVTRYQVRLDFAKIVAARAAAGATALAATDVMEVLPLPAGSIVISAGVHVTSAETVNTTATFSFGYGGATAAYAATAASNATGFTAANLANPTVFTAADTLDVLINTAAPTNAVLVVTALVLNINANL
jgi:hypothetical protein